MVVSVVDTREILQGYLDELTEHKDFAKFFTEDVTAKLEGITPQYFRGKEQVREWILGAHALGQMKVVDAFGCQTQAAAEFEFIRKDGVTVPYTVIYDFRDEKISALRLFFTGPIS